MAGLNGNRDYLFAKHSMAGGTWPPPPPLASAPPRGLAEMALIQLRQKEAEERMGKLRESIRREQAEAAAKAQEEATRH